MKARTWDAKNKKIEPLTNPQDLSINEDGTIFCEDKSLMFASGINDISNNEIFEGDIVQIPDDWDVYGMNAGEIYIVYFNFGGFRLKPKYNEKSRGFWLEEDNELNIIGNIYENPDLISS